MSCLIADPHPVVWDGIRSMVGGGASSIVIVAEASTGVETLALAARRRPDLALVSLNLAGPDGVETIVDLLRSHPHLIVVAFVDESQTHRVSAAIEAGAVGAILKSSAPAVILRGLCAAAAGEGLPPVLAERTDTSVGHLDSLSPREVQILTLLASGLSNRQIATHLYIGAETVKTHVRHILGKLEVDRRSAAVAFALRSGLID